MLLFLALLLLASSKVTDLKDGQTELVESESIFGSDKIFRFHVSAVGLSDLTISLTTYSDYSDPDMFVSIDEEPDLDNFEYSSFVWGSGSIVIPPEELEKDSDYYILVVCYTYCRYGLTVSYANEVVLTEGVPIDGSLSAGRQSIYNFIVPENPGELLTITVKHFTGYADVYVMTGNSEPTSDNTLDVYETWDEGLEFRWPDPVKNTLVRVAVMAYESLSYTIIAKNSDSAGTMIQASIPTTGEVETDQFQYYYINVTNPDDELYVSLTMFSGDGDIYVRAGGIPSLLKYNFSSVHMGNENLAISGADRKRIGSPTGLYYIGIYGYLHAAYTLLVTTSNSSFVNLVPGTPLSGSVNASAVEYYYLDFPFESTNITVHLAVASGNPDLYISLCTKNLSNCYFTAEQIKNPTGIFYSNHTTGGESIDIAHNKSTCPRKETCFYVIGVVGVSSYSTYTILATINNADEIVLRQGKPQSITMIDSSERYFKYTVINNTVTEIMFMLTPVYGDPDLYSAYNVQVGYDSYDKSSIKAGIEIDQVKYTKGIDGPWLDGVYHIMVHSVGPTSFSIVAMETVPGKNSTIQLYPGHPQKDTIYNFTDQDYRIYYFPIHYTEETKQPIVISLTAITGHFSLYVANQLSNLDWDNEVFYYNWKNSSNTSDPNYVITINPDDFWYKLDSTYLVLVMGEKYLADHSATYMVGFNTGDGPVTLSEDVPFSGVVIEGDYNYYTFPIHFNHEDVTISVTVMSGDPDLYISVSPNNTSPTTTNHDFKSTTFANEAITLIWEQGLKQKCPNLPETYKFGDPVHCFLYIGVFGFHSSNYIIRVHPSKSLPQLLSIGQPVSSSLNSTMYSFYYSIVDTQKDLHTVVQQVTGDSDLYISVLDKNLAGDNIGAWKRPTREDSQYSSASTVLSEQIDLTSKQLDSLCPSKNCIILAGVYCFSQVCSFSITMRQNEIEELMENQATYGTSDGSFVYYTYYCNKDSTDFLVTVTSLNDGDPNLFISKGIENPPTESNYNWASTGWGGDSILITHTDPVFKNGSMKGVYVIGINSWGPTSYAIMVNSSPKPIISLSSGVPQYGSLKGNSTAYYSFENYISQDILITITPTSGSGRMYASVYFSWFGDIYANLPDTKYLWSSVMSTDRFSLNISTSDPNFCTYCSILVAVKSDTSNMDYSIIGKNNLDITVLQNGMPNRGLITGAKWSLYSFDVLRKFDFDISITAYSGYPDVYVGTSKNVTWETFTWTAYYIENTLNLHISKNDEKFKIGTYYIIVNSYMPSIFTIVAHIRDTAVKLIEGWPLSYSLENTNTDFVQFRFDAITGHIAFCTIRADGAFKPIVYSKFQTIGATYSPATPEKYDQVHNSPIMSGNYSTISLSLEHTDLNSQLNIGVYSQARIDSEGFGTFQIYCSSTSQTTMLRLGLMSIQMLDQDMQQMRYEMVTESKGTIDAYVTPCIGDFKLEISSNWTIVFQDTPDVVVNRLTDGVIEGSINNANGRYYISVSTLKPLDYEYQIFELLTIFTKVGDPPFKRLNPGKNGILTWTSKAEREVEISWAPVESGEGVPQTDIQTTYQVYFTEENNHDLISACAIHYFHSRNKIQFLGDTKDTSIVVKLPEEKGFINVIAMLPKDAKSPIKEITYDPTEVLLTSPPESMGLLLFWVLATLLFLAVVASIYFYKKKKRAETILNYEMSDVRNVASVTSNVEKGGNRHDPYAPLSNIS